MVNEYLKLIEKIKEKLKYLFSFFDPFFDLIDNLVFILFKPLKPISDTINSLIKWIYKRF